jgi:hypothetical protein
VFQLSHTYVAKVNLDVAYVSVAIHACFKSIFQMFHLFQLYVVNVLSLCFKSRSGVRGKLSAAAGVPSWFMCRHGSAVPDAGERVSGAGA